MLENGTRNEPCNDDSISSHKTATGVVYGKHYCGRFGMKLNLSKMIQLAFLGLVSVLFLTGQIDGTFLSVGATVAPSIEPTEVPSFSPTISPTASPSASPSQTPTTTPSITPTNSPTLAPTRSPTARPTTSQPTLVPCDRGSHIVGGSCVECPRGRFSNITQSFVCELCAVGTYSATNGTALCTPCPMGSAASTEGAFACTMCTPGSYADAVQSSSCRLCDVGTYSAATNASNSNACKTCPYGRITATEGTINENECFDPLFNFISSTIALFVAVLLIISYLIGGRFHRIAYIRKEYNLKYAINLCIIIALKLTKFNEIKALEIPKQTSLKTILFFLFSILLVIGFIIIFYISSMMHVFYSSLIIWRGFTVSLDVPFSDILVNTIKDIGRIIKLPVIFPLIFYPFIYIIEKMSLLQLNLNNVNVTCEGCQASVELLINTMILGFTVIVIESDFQSFWDTSFYAINEALVNNSLFVNFPTYFRMKTFKYYRFIFYAFVVWAMSAFHPFRIVLQYFMGFITLGKFIENGGIHNSTESCDLYMDLNYDTIMSYIASVFALFLLQPAVYTLAKVLVPRIPNWALKGSDNSMGNTAGAHGTTAVLNNSQKNNFHNDYNSSNMSGGMVGMVGSSSDQNNGVLSSSRITTSRTDDLTNHNGHTIATFNNNNSINNNNISTTVGNGAADKYIITDVDHQIYTADNNNNNNMHNNNNINSNNDINNRPPITNVKRTTFAYVLIFDVFNSFFSPDLVCLEIAKLWCRVLNRNLNPRPEEPAEEEQRLLEEGGGCGQNNNNHNSNNINNNGVHDNRNNINNNINSHSEDDVVPITGTVTRHRVESDDVSYHTHNSTNNNNISNNKNSNNTSNQPAEIARDRDHQLNSTDHHNHSNSSVNLPPDQQEQQALLVSNNRNNSADDEIKRQSVAYDAHYDNNNSNINNVNQEESDYILENFQYNTNIVKTSHSYASALIKIMKREQNNRLLLYTKWKTTTLYKLPTYVTLCKCVYDELTGVKHTNSTNLITSASYNSNNKSNNNTNNQHNNHNSNNHEEHITHTIENEYFFFSFLYYIMSFFIVGHLCTKVGRRYWYLILWNYVTFIHVSLGVWTDDALQAFDLVDNIDSIFKEYILKANPKSTEEDAKIYFSRALAAIIGMRSILYQIFSPITLLSVLCIDIAGNPMFIYSKVLKNKLPPPFINNCYELAHKVEMHYSVNGDVSEYQWAVTLRGIQIYYTQSRAIQFLLNIYLFLLSIGILFMSREYWLISSLVVLIPYSIIYALVFIVYFGKLLDIKDHDVRYITAFITCISRICPASGRDSFPPRAVTRPPASVDILDEPSGVTNLRVKGVRSVPSISISSSSGNTDSKRVAPVDRSPTSLQLRDNDTNAAAPVSIQRLSPHGAGMASGNSFSRLRGSSSGEETVVHDFNDNFLAQNRLLQQQQLRDQQQ